MSEPWPPPCCVRPIVIGVIRKGDCILVGEGYDPAKREVFYRPLGGAIEFGEDSKDALAREIEEEIGAEITDLRYLGILENMFTYNDTPMHEIVLVYEARLSDASRYDVMTIEGADNGVWMEVLWKPVADFERGQARLYPLGLLQLITP